MADLPSDIISDGFNREEWIRSVERLGIPFFVSCIVAAIILKRSNFKVHLLPSIFATRQWSCVENEVVFERWLFWCLVVIWVVAVLPLLLVLAWGVLVYIDVNHLLGVVIILIITAWLLVAFGLLYWHSNKWRFSRSILFPLVTGFVLSVLFLAWVSFLSRPFTYLGISFVFIGFNMIPMTMFVYLNAQVLTKPVEKYESVNLMDLSVLEKEGKEGKNGKTDATSLTSELAKDGDIGFFIPENLEDTRKLRLGLLIASGLLLGLYAALVATLSSDGKGVGFITFGVIIVLDFLVLICVWVGKIRTPWRTCVALVVCRIIIIVFGDQYWFCGHSLMYLVVSIFFCQSLIDYYIPDQRDSANKRLSDTLLKEEEVVLQKRQTYRKLQENKYTGFVYEHVDSVALGVLTVGFIVDLYVNSRVSQYPLYLTKTHPQYIVGILSLFVAGVVNAATALYRLYGNNNYHLNPRIFLACIFVWAVIGGIGYWIFTITKSVIIVSMCAFLPPFIMLTEYQYIAWFKNDYNLFPVSSNTSRRSPTGQHSDHSPLEEEKLPEPSSTRESKEKKETKSERHDDAEGTKEDDSTEKDSKTGTGEHAMQVLDIRDNRDTGPYPFREGSGRIGAFLNHLYLWRIVLIMVINFALVVALGAVIAIFSPPRYVGYTISAALMINFFAFVPLFEWFNTFQLSKNIIFCSNAALILHVAYHTIFYILEFKGKQSLGALGLLFSFFLYPAVVGFGAALYKWRDDNWKFEGRFVRGLLIICACLVLAFFLAVAAVFSPWEIGGALTVCYVLTIILVIGIPWLQSHYPRQLKWLLLVVLACVLIFSGGVASQPDRGFIGYSIAWGVIFFALAVKTYNLHRPKETGQFKTIEYLYSPSVFPVYRYSTQPGLKNPLVSDGSRVGYVLALLAIAFSWGAVAIVFIPRRWVGLGFCSFALVCFVIYCMEMRSRTRLVFHEAVTYLVEGTKLYRDIVRKSQVTALRAQITSKAIARSALGSATELDEEERDLESGGGGSGASGRRGSGASGKDAKYHPSPTKRDKTYGLGFGMGAPEEVTLDDADYRQLGLDELENQAGKAELDWRFLLGLRTELARAIPSMNAVGCRESATRTVDFKNQTLTRRDALRLLLKLDDQTSKIYYNQMKYITHFEFEVILAAEALKSEMELEMLTMLREEGQSNITLETIKSLKRGSEQRNALEAMYKKWKKKQIEVQEQRRIKREEEEKEHKRREEEALLYQQQQQLMALEISKKEQEENKRKAELLLKKQEELHERELLEEQKEKERMARLAREREEKRKQEEELINKFADDRKRREEEAKLKELREKEEKLRAQEEEERRRKQDERKRRRDKVDQENKLLIDAALAKRVCTFLHTGPKFTKQRYYICNTCSSNGKLAEDCGVCEVCKDVCHADHEIKYGGESGFYCDCGAAGCNAMKKILTYESVVKDYQETKKQFEDPDFKPDASSLFMNPLGNNSRKKHWLDYQWKRPEQFAKIKSKHLTPQIFAQGTKGAAVDPNDIKQGSLGDCWLLSAMSVLTRRPQSLYDIFISKEHSAAGVYEVKFTKNGKSTVVIVDSLFPVTKQDIPAFAHSTDDNELWVSILEKAYAKLHRNYESIESGFVDQALIDMTGGTGSRTDMSKADVKQQIRNGSLWERLLSYHDQGFLMGAGTPAGSDSEANASPSGIIQGHAYALLRVVEVDGNRLVQLRNPWGRKEWTGDWSDKSPLWTRRLKAKVDFRDEEDGTFWMSFLDFTVHFEDVYVCRFFDDRMGWKEERFSGEWKGKTAGGCTNFFSVKSSPQYLLSVPTSPVTIVMTLAQKDTRGTDKKLAAISIEIYNNAGQRIQKRHTGEMVCSNPESYIFRRDVTLETVLQPQETPYTVLISTFDKGNETTYNGQIFYKGGPLTYELAAEIEGD